MRIWLKYLESKMKKNPKNSQNDKQLYKGINIVNTKTSTHKINKRKQTHKNEIKQLYN